MIAFMDQLWFQRLFDGRKDVEFFNPGYLALCVTFSGH